MYQTLKRKSCHFDKIFITGCPGSCHFDENFIKMMTIPFQCKGFILFNLIGLHGATTRLLINGSSVLR